MKGTVISPTLRMAIEVAAGKLACGLGGVLLISVPMIALFYAEIAVWEYTATQSLPIPELLRFEVSVFLSLPGPVQFVLGFVTPIVAGFAHGWRAGSSLMLRQTRPRRS